MCCLVSGGTAGSAEPRRGEFYEHGQAFGKKPYHIIFPMATGSRSAWEGKHIVARSRKGDGKEQGLDVGCGNTRRVRGEIVKL